LSHKRRVTITDFRGKTLVSIREYYNKDGKELPTAKGISLTAEQWATFKKNIPGIEKAIKKLESSS
ncbi:RNA polymerase II transcriptional coactivator KELP, partial [Capsicum chinense]